MQVEPRKIRRSPPSRGPPGSRLLDRKVVPDEVGRVAVVGENAADLRGGQYDEVGLLVVEILYSGVRIAEVELVGRAAYEIGITSLFEMHPDRSVYHAPVASDINLSVGIIEMHFHRKGLLRDDELTLALLIVGDRNFRRLCLSVRSPVGLPPPPSTSLFQEI